MRFGGRVSKSDHLLAQPLRLLTTTARITTEVVEEPEQIDTPEVIYLPAIYQRYVVSGLSETTL